MSFKFPCPWCSAPAHVSGSRGDSWRFRLPCALCDREMVVTWDDGLVVSKIAKPRLKRSDDDTVRFRVANSA